VGHDTLLLEHIDKKGEAGTSDPLKGQQVTPRPKDTSSGLQGLVPGSLPSTMTGTLDATSSHQLEFTLLIISLP